MKHMSMVVVKAVEKGQVSLAQEAECEGTRHADIGDGEGGVMQQSCRVGRGRGGHKGKARVQGVARGGGV